jgi:hypothetical protein
VSVNGFHDPVFRTEVFRNGTYVASEVRAGADRKPVKGNPEVMAEIWQQAALAIASVPEGDYALDEKGRFFTLDLATGRARKAFRFGSLSGKPLPRPLKDLFYSLRSLASG